MIVLFWIQAMGMKTKEQLCIYLCVFVYMVDYISHTCEHIRGRLRSTFFVVRTLTTIVSLKKNILSFSIRKQSYYAEVCAFVWVSVQESWPCGDAISFCVDIDLILSSHWDYARLTSEIICGHWRSSVGEICHFWSNQTEREIWI